ncbi:hypothetical protein L3Q82_005174 [Scortum barcoo]|uniref:Uncharacterized protein n=1 Tax=Scortum barcoo TaxID=214431 RepID=A0ACB8V9B9_9TELE|nr:hypothetical protein L3Q82_005174 [Scortum barcoo]
MSFLRRVAGRSLRDRVRSSVTREELVGVEPLLALRIERSQLRWLGHLISDAPWGRLPREVFQACPTGRRPVEDPGHAGETMSLGWPGNALGSPRKSWRKCLGACAVQPCGILQHIFNLSLRLIRIPIGPGTLDGASQVLNGADMPCDEDP